MALGGDSAICLSFDTLYQYPDYIQDVEDRWRDSRPFYSPCCICIRLQKLTIAEARFASVNLELTPWAGVGDASASRGRWLIFDGNAKCDCLHAGGELVQNLEQRCATG